ncbi:MAG: hypothetical protein ABR599_04850 [Gemmatimonadota bacterium]
MRTSDAAAEESLAFHAAAPDASRGYVAVLARVGPDGGVRVRRWDAPDYTAAAREEVLSAAEIRARIAREARDGWRFTAPVQHVLAWLDAVPPASTP